jgi:phosphoglycolate phosphatase
MPVKLIIFDLDGTLVDTRADITNALNHAIKPLGLNELGTKEVTALIGEGITRLVVKVLGKDHGARVKEVQDRFLSYYGEHLADMSRPYPGVREVLGALDGTRKAVLSNKREALSRRLLEMLELSHYFELIAGGDSAPEKKPSPVPVHHLMSTLGARPDETAMVGDSDHDIKAGREAGLALLIGVTYGFRDVSVLGDADHLIDTFEDLPALLYRLKGLHNRRREDRHGVSNIFREYFKLSVMVSGRYMPATLLNFSEHGLLLDIHSPLKPGSLSECILSVPRSLNRDIHLVLRISYCRESSGTYHVGGEIEEVGSEMWFNIFRKIVLFMKEREGDVF